MPGQARGKKGEGERVLLAVESGEVACRLQDSSRAKERGDGDDRRLKKESFRRFFRRRNGGFLTRSVSMNLKSHVRQRDSSGR
jgi:hypothetical protein